MQIDPDAAGIGVSPQDIRIADQDRTAGRPHRRVERGLQADLRPDARGVAGRDRNDRFVGCHGVFYGLESEDANGVSKGRHGEQGALEQDWFSPARCLYPCRAPPDQAAAHAGRGAALSQPATLQHREARRHAAQLPAGGPAWHGALSRSRAVRSLRARAPRLPAAAVDLRVGRRPRPRSLSLPQGWALGHGGALARSRAARPQAGVQDIARAHR